MIVMQDWVVRPTFWLAIMDGGLAWTLLFQQLVSQEVMKY